MIYTKRKVKKLNMKRKKILRDKEIRGTFNFLRNGQ